jgi:hypothetical protein
MAVHCTATIQKTFFSETENPRIFQQYLWITKVYCERFVYIFQFFGQRLILEKEREHL